MEDKGDFEEVVESPKESPAEPQTLHSRDPVIQKLYDLMNESHVGEEKLRAVIADKGYYPKETPIENYDKDFISGCLIAAWDQVYAQICEYNSVPF